MIYEHEIPNGSRLYFGNLAKLKRELEFLASEMLSEQGFEEILTPNFSYSQYQSIDNAKKLITLNDESNNTLALRADSTLDVVRIITKRLGRTTEHDKWFYIQPVFTYPSNEIYQIGLEWINHQNVSDIININCDLLKKFDVKASVQISNINIPLLISQNWDIDINLFKNGEIDALYSLKIDWLNSLIETKNIEDLKNIIDSLPEILVNDIKKLIEIVEKIDYFDIVVAPLFYSTMKYYDDVYYKIIKENLTLAKGGAYKSEGINSLGFAIYTDNILKIKQKGQNE